MIRTVATPIARPATITVIAVAVVHQTVRPTFRRTTCSQLVGRRREQTHLPTARKREQLEQRLYTGASLAMGRIWTATATALAANPIAADRARESSPTALRPSGAREVPPERPEQRRPRHRHWLRVYASARKSNRSHGVGRVNVSLEPFDARRTGLGRLKIGPL